MNAYSHLGRGTLCLAMAGSLLAFFGWPSAVHAENIVNPTRNDAIAVLGIDEDKNGVRDDLDSLIDARFPSAPEQRAAYRFTAKSIQSEWKAFSQNAQVSYEELLPYSVHVALGLDLIEESGAESALSYSDFLRHLINTTARVRFEDRLSDVYAGKILPVYVKKKKEYAKFVAEGLDDYQRILRGETSAD